MKEFDIDGIVYTLIGPITPVGETNADDARFKSLKEFAELAYSLIFDLVEVSQYANNYEYSMKRAGEHAKETLEQIRELIG